MSTLLKNVEKLNEKEYMLILSGDKIIELWDKETIRYIPEIQRGKKIISNSAGDPIEVPIFSQSNVNKIKKSILDKNFFVSQLTFNADENDTDVEYNEKTKELKLNKGFFGISDGQHRIRALKMIQEEQQNFENNFDLKSIAFPIKITNYNEEKAQQQFYQFTLGTKISSSRSEFFNHKDYANKIVSSLHKDSVLSGKIETIKNNISKNEPYNIVSFATLKNAIEMNFNTERYVSASDEKETTEYLKDFFAELLNIIPEFNSHEDRIRLKEENSLLCENFTFYGYLAIAHHIQNKKDWKSLMPYIREMDMHKDQKPWLKKVVKENTKKSSKNKDKEQKVNKYTIINNSQSRKDMATEMERLFRHIVEEHLKMASNE